jgi:Na+/H+ antiporter NhaC
LFITPGGAIVLAFITKQTILSLFVAVWVGATMLNGFNPLVGFAVIFKDNMIPSIASEWNAGLIVLVTLAGGFVGMLRDTASAPALWASRQNSLRPRRLFPPLYRAWWN